MTVTTTQPRPHGATLEEVAKVAGVSRATVSRVVNGSPRVPAEPGGDFVDKAGNGMSDCDSHGTLTASIIAGRPAPTDGFIGVAPGVAREFPGQVVGQPVADLFASSRLGGGVGEVHQVSVRWCGARGLPVYVRSEPGAIS